MISFKTKTFSYTISESGRNISLKSIHDGKELLDPAAEFCSRLTMPGGEVFNPLSVRWENQALSVTYTDGTTARIGVSIRDEYIVFSYLGAEKDNGDYTGFESLSFLDIKSNIDYDTPGFVTSCMSMSLNTKIKEYPGKNNILLAEVCPHVGADGGKAALLGAEESEIIAVMRRVLDEVPDNALPKGAKNGPYARDCAEAGDTYTIMSIINKANVDTVIEDCQKFGVRQIHFHQGAMFRQGDFEIRESNCPGGEKELAETIAKLHSVDIKAILHPYTFFIDNYSLAMSSPSKYLSPVPHSDLLYGEEYTLAEDITADGDILAVTESLEGADNRIGYTVEQTNLLWVDDELILLGDVDQSGGGFTGCLRGACKTAAAPHKKGAKVRRLKSYFGYLAPKKNSALFFEIARNTADFYNRMDFDGFYLDAIDGVFILDGNEYAWYHAMLFTNEMFKHLKKPPIFNCCYGPQYPSTWYARTRMGALDSAGRGYRDFIDVHVNYNERNAERMFMTGELGWWSLYFAKNEDTILNKKIMYDEDIEYLCVKMLATDVSQCWQGSFTAYRSSLLLQSYLEKLALYDKLRRSGGVPQSLKAKLRAPASEFVLSGDDGDYNFRRAYTQRKTAESFNDSRNILSFDNPFTPQKPKIRIETLMAAAPYDDDGGVTVLDFDGETPVTLNKTYAFDKEIDASEARGTGVWIHGDGRGETICLRLRNEPHISEAHLDRYVKVDFTGWRYYSFAENNCAEPPHSDWPRTELNYKVFTDVRPFYAHYTSSCKYDKLKYLDILLDPRLDPAGYEIKMRPVRMLPVVKYRLLNPSVKIGGRSVTFMTALESGTFLEYDGKECVVYDNDKNILAKPEVSGEHPTLSAGENIAEIRCDGVRPATAAGKAASGQGMIHSIETANGGTVRAALTLRTVGEKV